MDKKIDLRRICKPGVFSNSSNSSSHIINEKKVTVSDILLPRNSRTPTVDSHPSDGLSCGSSKLGSMHTRTSENISTGTNNATAKTASCNRKKVKTGPSKHDLLAEKLARYQTTEMTLREQAAKVSKSSIKI